jgi:hypothetical protein
VLVVAGDDLLVGVDHLRVTSSSPAIGPREIGESGGSEVKVAREYGAIDT